MEQADTQTRQDPASASFADFSAVRKDVRASLERGDHDEATRLLEGASEAPDDMRELEENVWLYRQLGDLYRSFDREDDAIGAYQRAYELDPRERDVLQPLSELLLARKRADEGIEVVQALLMHHKRELPAEDRSLIYRRLGALYEAGEEYEKARHAFEKALEEAPSDPQALTGLLRTVGQIGEASDVIEVRHKLIKSLDHAEARSMALVALGDDWAEKFNDPGRALDTYEQAVAESPTNVRAVERIARVAREMGDWRRVSRAFFTLSKLATNDTEAADWLIKSSLVARDELWEPDKALTGLRKALELDPTRLDAFKAVTSILVDAHDWEGLEEAYLQVIDANGRRPDADPNLMAVLWQKLGELYKNHLARPADAIVAYDHASSLLPDNIELHLAVAELAENDNEQVDLAIRHLEALLLRIPEDLSLTDRLARAYLRKKDVDRAFSLFRVLPYQGEALDEKARAFVKRFETPIFRPLKHALGSELLQRHVMSARLDPAISETFALLKPALEEFTGEDRGKYKLKRRDRVQLDSPLAFNNIYKSIAASLGYASHQLPELWRKPDQQGLINGALIPEGLIVGDELLGSGREKHIAFVVAKQLFLFMPPFYLAAIRPLHDLQGFFVRGLALSNPSLDLAPTLASDHAFKELRKRLKGPDLEKLRQAIGRITGQSTDVDLGTWIEALEDSANRVGFIFCDDLQVVEDSLRNDPQPISSRSIDQRMQSLVDYSLSEQYLSLRQKLGINVA